eukprot:CAMPEP_0113937038 /NCGR_PEP_ID=MMETSP1339-20121228/3746_1 /TAXON_ID=94617 /ORGANISM="Fibrocapsa japonica" /LENGTH=441 /DNA_ID=CAMNT_0000939653 /DNA_START=105 /DNA_END=1430 /DNA_ORIENTATION=- /assembly_acc=CAM_ASM_000762
MASVFCIGLIVCAAVGYAGPEVFENKTNEPSTIILDDAGYGIWNGEIDDMKREHRFLWVTAKFARPENTDPDLTFGWDQQMFVTVDGIVDPETKVDVHNLAKAHELKEHVECIAGRDLCEDILVFFKTNIRFPTYHFLVEFRHPNELAQDINGNLDIALNIFYVNADYTAFEMGWGYLFMIITTVVALMPVWGYYWQLCWRLGSWKEWSMQQRWVAVLLPMLWFFNDPFFAGQVVEAPAHGLPELNIFFIATFVAVLLLYWLCLMDQIRTDHHATSVGSRKIAWPRWVIWKSILCFVIWLIIMSTFIELYTTQTKDPTFDGITESTDERKSMAFTAATSLFMAIYIIWMIYLIVSAFHHIKEMLPCYHFLFGVTLLVIIITVVAVFLASLFPVQSTPVQFLGLYGMYNMYIWMLAFAYTPLKPEDQYSGGSGDIQMAGVNA